MFWMSIDQYKCKPLEIGMDKKAWNLEKILISYVALKIKNQTNCSWSKFKTIYKQFSL